MVAPKKTKVVRNKPPSKWSFWVIRPTKKIFGLVRSNLSQLQSKLVITTQSIFKNPFKKNLEKAFIPKRNTFSSHIPAKSTINKVFKPSSPELIKQSLNSLTGPIGRRIDNKTFAFGFKSLTQLTAEATRINFGDIWRILRLQLVKLSNFKKLNWLIARLTLASFIIFIAYLSFFDTFFIVTNYQIVFTRGENSSQTSYLDSNQTGQLLDLFSRSRLGGIFPSNQYWFLTDQNLTLNAKTIVPEIQSVRIIERYWPSGAKLQITTDPILATLAVKQTQQTQYWRVSTEGRVLGLDEAALYENLVQVELPFSFEQPISDLSEVKVFQNFGEQLSRLYFARQFVAFLVDNGLQVASTSINSLNPADPDVNFYLTSGTKLMFDVSKFDLESQKSRLKLLLESGARDQILDNQLLYIDMRISRQVFVCARNTECAK